MKKYRLVIFDMDDTLVSSGNTWINAERKLYEYLGSEYSFEAAKSYKGMNAMDVGRRICRYVNPKNGITEDDCGKLLRKWLLDEFRNGDMDPMPGADLLISELYGKVRMMIASGSPIEGIESAIENFGWRAYFPYIVSSEEVARGKPFPDVFLLAADRMRCDPADVLVIEDSLHGVKAAKNAGMDCFAIPLTDDPLIKAEADRIFTRLDAIPLEYIIGVF